MSETLHYDRYVRTLTRDTPIVFSLKAAETPNAPASMSASSTAEIDVRLQADADPESGSDVQDFFKLLLHPEISGTGLITWVGTMTPVLGNGTLGTPVPISIPHEQDLDTWQREAGQDRVDSEGDFVLEIIKTADYTLLLEDNLKIVANTGAAGLVIIQLPAAIALTGGRPYRVRGRVAAGFNLRFQTNGTDVISQGAGVGSAGGYIQSAVVGAQVELINDVAGKWVAAPLGPTNWSLT